MYSENFPEIGQKIHRYLNGDSSMSFEELAIALYEYQRKNCSVYAEFLRLSGQDKKKYSSPAEIPFLPISLFKSHQIKCGKWKSEWVFESSSTTGAVPSKHFIFSLQWYQEVSRKGFESFYGPLKEHTIYALLPSYLERNNSSLVTMVDHFYKSGAEGDFFLHNFESLYQAINEKKRNTFLMGVSFALLDFASVFPGKYPHLTIIETGGMKGRRKELTRAALHEALQYGFGVQSIHSEYGMTELQSQAYSNGEGMFTPSALMKVYPRSMYDPFSKAEYGKQSALNIIDLANWSTCAFIASDDIGSVYKSGQFEVLGRLEISDIRGCNLMVI